MQMTDQEIGLVIHNLRSKSYLTKKEKYLLLKLAYDFRDAFKQVEPNYDDKVFFNCVETGFKRCE